MEDYTSYPLQQPQDDYYHRQFQPLNRQLHSPHASIHSDYGPTPQSTRQHHPPPPPQATHADHSQFYSHHPSQIPQHNGTHEAYGQPAFVARQQPFTPPEQPILPPRLPAALGSDVEA